MPTTMPHDAQSATLECECDVTQETGELPEATPANPPLNTREEANMAHDAIVVTLRGRCMARDLVVGDLVLTRDNGYQPILWIGRPNCSRAGTARLRLAKGCIADGCPDHDLELSARQRILMTLRGAMAESFSDDAPVEAFVRARDLVGLNGVAEVETTEQQSVQILTQRHEVILANGVWTETFQPDCTQLNNLPLDQRDELERVLPQIREQRDGKAFAAARAAMPVPILQEILRQRSS